MAEQDALLEPPPRRIQFPPQAAGPASGMAAGPGLPGYAELHCLSNFSFLRGASSPAELVQRAKALGYQALALTDDCSVAGAVRAFEAARDCGMALIHGSEFAWGPLRVVALARDLNGWGNLCEFISAARSRADKGQYLVDADSPWQLLREGCECIIVPQRAQLPAGDVAAMAQAVQEALAQLGSHCWLGVELLLAPDDSLWLQSLQDVAGRMGLSCVACGDVHMHARSRKPLQDLVTALRLGCTVAECGFELHPNAERHLRSRLRLGGIYPRAMLDATVQIAARCDFTLSEISYHYPQESVLPGMDARQTLAWHTWQGAAGRYPQGIPERVARQLKEELELIAECRYEMYFLTVHDIVRYARSEGILCQGRGSAANSAVCYCLGITAVDPTKTTLLMARFISRERSEPPDIDVDFEHSRREIVIQYIYEKYGRDRAALTAVVSCWRTRGALRDAGKALGVDAVLIDAMARQHHWFSDAEDQAAEPGPEQEDGPEPEPLDPVLGWVRSKLLRLARLRERLGDECPQLSPQRARLWLELALQLRDSPRHLSQHVGGFVLTHGPLTRLVPVEPAAMEGRSVIQWDKDDLDTMDLLKVDVLALGMLTVLRGSLDARAALRGPRWELADIPQDDCATYDMICRADTVGTFQIESRAQMSMLPRLRPRVFYDLVVEVAIVRPGPIQGGMVHPYLQARERQRQGDALVLEKPALKEALARTLGVPIFQEQVMQIAMIAAGFSAGEADELRRSMAAWRRKGGVHRFERQLIDGMLANGYSAEFAQAIFRQMLGFGEYGFPESHAYSFAMLAYASAWLKRHEPACFLMALLNAQPMGFYTPSQLIQDARRHGVRVLPVDVRHSDWDCTLEAPHERIAGVELPQPAVRLGLRMVAQLSEKAGERVVQARTEAAFKSTEDLALRAWLQRAELQALAAADALQGLSGHRRQQMWDAAALLAPPPLFAGVPVHEAPVQLAAAPEGEEILFDYAATGLSLRRHPLALLRDRLRRHGLRTALELRDTLPGMRVRACGIVTVRQRPPTAKGTVFITLEDETGTVNLVVWPDTVTRWGEPLLGSRLLAVEGVWQSSAEWGGRQAPGTPQEGPQPEDLPAVRHLIVQRARDMSRWLGRLGGSGVASRNFH
jgi:error-prone DNA polymerase